MTNGQLARSVPTSNDFESVVDRPTGHDRRRSCGNSRALVRVVGLDNVYAIFVGYNSLSVDECQVLAGFAAMASRRESRAATLKFVGSAFARAGLAPDRTRRRLCGDDQSGRQWRPRRT